jgi:hypothetical protein
MCTEEEDFSDFSQEFGKTKSGPRWQLKSKRVKETTYPPPEGW